MDCHEDEPKEDVRHVWSRCSEESSAPRSIDYFLQSAFDSSGLDNVSFNDEYLVHPSLHPSVSSWDMILRRRGYALIIISLGMSSAADAAELFSIGFVLGDPAFRRDILHDDLAGSGALVAGILTLGLIAGGLGTAAAEHRFGRKTILTSGLALSATCGLACAATTTAAAFAACRWAAGVGIGAVLASQPALSTELSPPRERGLIVSVANGCWTVGTILNAVWALVIFGVLGWSWRVYLVVATLPGVISLMLIIWFVPDSPRYHALHGDYEGAARNANSTALAMGYHGTPLGVEEVAFHYGCSISRNLSQLASSSLQRAWESVRMIYKKELQRPTVIIQVLWVSASIGAALAYWINTLFQNLHLSNVYASFVLLNCAAIPGNIASALLTDRVGRNTFFAASMVTSGCFLFIVAAIVSASSDADSADVSSRTVPIVLATCFYYASLTAVYTVLYVMVAEIFPTTVRSTGVAVCSTFGRIASFVAQFLNGALIDRPAALLSVGASVLCAGGILSMIFPPTEMSRRAILDNHANLLSEELEDNDERGKLRGGEISMGQYRTIT